MQDWKCPSQQLLWNTLWQKYCKNTVTFLFTILCTVLTTRKKYSTLILICVLLNPLCEWHPIFIAKSSHRIKEQPFIRAGFAIPEGALLSGFHCIMKQNLSTTTSISLDHKQANAMKSNVIRQIEMEQKFAKMTDFPPDKLRKNKLIMIKLRELWIKRNRHKCVMLCRRKSVIKSVTCSQYSFYKTIWNWDSFFVDRPDSRQGHTKQTQHPTSQFCWNQRFASHLPCWDKVYLGRWQKP